MAKDEILKECSFVIEGLPKTKSNHNLVNRQGKKILPKDSAYAQYERNIVYAILEQIGERKFESKIYCVLKVYFKHKNRHPDLNNMPKSICDGIEKSNIIENDRDIIGVYLDELYDYDNPRVEVFMYDYRYFKPLITVIKRDDDEIAELEKEHEEAVAKKKKVKTRKTKSASKELLCSNCGKPTDKDHSRPISKSKDVICNKCIVLGRL